MEMAKSKTEIINSIIPKFAELHSINEDEARIIFANVKWSSFPTASPFLDSDMIVGLQGTTNYQSPLTNLSTYILGKTGSLYLQINNNFSDLNNFYTSAVNIGLNNGYIIYGGNTDQILPSPLPTFIGIGNTTTQTFKFPNKSILSINNVGKMFFINNYGSADQNFQDYLGNPLFTVKGRSNYIYTFPDQLSPNWYTFSLVSSINSQVGIVTIDLQNAYDNSTSPQITGPLNFFDGTGSTVNIFPTSSNSMLNLNSTTKGFSPPIWTSAQESINTASLGSGDAGIEWYNSDTATKNYWDGSILQQGLTLQHLEPGDGIFFDDSVPGHIIINATGGGTPLPGAFASWAIQNNPVTTVVGSSFTPIAVDSGGSSFYNISSSNFTNQILLVSGVSTIVSTYIGPTTQNFLVNANIAIVNGTTTNVLYKGSISILQSGGTLTATPAQLLGSYPNASQNLPVSLSGVVQLNTGDSIFLQLSNPNITSNCRGAWINFQIASIAGSIPNSNGLTQGSNNLYLSQDGGSTYQNVSGTPVVGNLAEFSTTGGQLMDSGVPASAIFLWKTVSGTTQQMAMNTGYIITGVSPVTFTLPLSSAGIGEIKITGYGNTNWIVQTNAGQTIRDNGLSTSTSVQSGTPYDAASFIYAGDGSGIFDIQYQNGMEITLN